ncbi:MAG: hypothetical protein PHW53_04955 [Patescibacteria group bacterium]|nr:hypothetical protein [Patescibacteria group bacterium]
MKPSSKTYTITGTDADGICLSQTPLAAGALTIAGALSSGGAGSIPTAQHVTVTCAGSDAARSFVVTGTDDAGNAQTETLAGSATSTTTSAKNFKTVSSVVVDAATAGAVTVGWVATLETPWIPLNRYKTPFSYSYQADIGAATYLLEGTLDNVQDSSITPLAFTLVASGTVDIAGGLTVPAEAVRLKVTAWTSGTIVFKIMQAG